MNCENPLKPEDIRERLTFANKRANDLLALNGGNLAGADSSARQQLIQEFFFHLVGTTEVLAQLVNEIRNLGLEAELVAIPPVVEKLLSTDPIKPILNSLHTRTRRQPLPSDPYSDEGYVFRILNYRHYVTHRRRNPLLFRVGSTPPVSFFLDPRDPNSSRVPSEKSLEEELAYMMDLVKRKCEKVLVFL